MQISCNKSCTRISLKDAEAAEIGWNENDILNYEYNPNSKDAHIIFSKGIYNNNNLLNVRTLRRSKPTAKVLELSLSCPGMERFAPEAANYKIANNQIIVAKPEQKYPRLNGVERLDEQQDVMALWQEAKDLTIKLNEYRKKLGTAIRFEIENENLEAFFTLSDRSSNQ